MVNIILNWLAITWIWGQSTKHLSDLWIPLQVSATLCELHSKYLGNSIWTLRFAMPQCQQLIFKFQTFKNPSFSKKNRLVFWKKYWKLMISDLNRLKKFYNTIIIFKAPKKLNKIMKNKKRKWYQILNFLLDSHFLDSLNITRNKEISCIKSFKI